jgi:hypothetical protein
VQIDVEQARARGIELIVLEHGVARLLLPFEDHVENGMEAMLAGQDASQLALCDRERMRRLAVAVENSGHEALAAKTARGRAAASIAGFHLQLDALAGHVGS